MATYQETILADAPLVYYRLNETSGTAADNLGSHTSEGVINGTVTRSQASVGTIDGSAVKITYNTAGNVTTASLPSTGDMTVEIWWRKDPGFTFSHTQRLFTFGAMDVTIGINNGYFRAGDGTLNDGFVNAAWVDGNWHHFVVTRTGSTYGFYVDGVHQGNKFGNSTARSGTFTVAGTTASQNYHAWFDEPALYNRALAASEITEHYNAAFAAQVVNVSVAAPVATSTVTAVDALNKQVKVAAPVATSNATASDATVTAVDIWHNTVQATEDGDLFNFGGSATSQNIAFYGTSSTGNANALYFKFPDPRQTGALIDYLTFRFNVTTTSSPITFRVDRVTSAWVETQETQPTKVSTGVTGTISATGVLTITLTDDALAGWNSGAAWHGIALTATSTTGNASIATSENATLSLRPTMESQLMSNAVHAVNAAPVVTSSVLANDATVKAGISAINAAPAVTSTVTAIAGNAQGIKNINVAAPAVASTTTAPAGRATIVNPDYTVIAPAATSSVFANAAYVVGGSEIDIAAGVATTDVEAVPGGYTNKTDVVVTANTAVTNIRAISTYDRNQDRYMAIVPTTVDADDTWYMMEETSGTVAADAAFSVSGNKQDGTYVGSPEFNIEGPQARKAVRFDGVDDYLLVNYFQNQFSIQEGTLEFSIKTSQQNGTLFTGPNGTTNITLVNGEIQIGSQSDAYSWRVRKNIADGQWHHVIISTPFSSTIVTRPSFVMIDGVVVLRRNDSPITFIIPQTAMAKYHRGTPSVPASDFLAGEMRDLIIREHYAISIESAQKLYYEWSNAVVINATPATTQVVGQVAQARGNVKKMLVVYGLPYSLRYFGSGGEVDVFRSIAAGFYLPNNGQPFYLNGYLCYPVSITGDTPNAAGVANKSYIDNFNGRYVDDTTGNMRFLDFDKDLTGPVTEYDAITVVNYPAVTPVRSGDTLRGDYDQPDYGLNDSEWGLIRDRFRDRLLNAVAQGVDLWIAEAHMAEHLGFIQAYDIHDTGSWFAGMVPNQTTTANIAAAELDDAHLSPAGTPNYDALGVSYDYSPIWQANAKRRIVSTEPGLTDIPAYEMTDRIYRYLYDRFNGYADVQAWDVKDRTNGLIIGDELVMNVKDVANTAGGTGDLDPVGTIEARQGGRKAIVSAKPQGVVGKVISKEMERFYGPRGRVVENPYKDNVLTIIAERGTVVRNTVLQGRVFIEFMDSNIGRTSIAVDRYPDMWEGGRNRNVSTWSLDIRRNGPYNGNPVGGTWVPITDQVPAISFNGRGLNWLQDSSSLPEGAVRIFAPSASVESKAIDAKITKIRNIKINATPAVSKVEVREPYIYGRPDVLVLADVATTEVVMNGTGVNIKAAPVVSEVVAPDAMVEGEVEMIYVYIDNNRNIILYLEEE